jgi:hypothetical protein
VSHTCILLALATRICAFAFIYDLRLAFFGKSPTSTHLWEFLSKMQQAFEILFIEQRYGSLGDILHRLWLA